MADDAQRSAQLENLPSLLPAMDQAGILGEDSPRDLGQGPPLGRKKARDAALINSQIVRKASPSEVRRYDAGKKIT